jgi:hypothetical protein
MFAGETGEKMGKGTALQYTSEALVPNTMVEVHSLQRGQLSRGGRSQAKKTLGGERGKKKKEEKETELNVSRQVKERRSMNTRFSCV